MFQAKTLLPYKHVLLANLKRHLKIIKHFFVLFIK